MSADNVDWLVEGSEPSVGYIVSILNRMSVEWEKKIKIHP